MGEGAVASHSKGSAERAKRFELDCEPPGSIAVGRRGDEENPLLMSRPNVRAPLVNARGRIFVFDAVSSFCSEGAKVNVGLGCGDISMRSARSLSGVKADVARGGE